MAGLRSILRLALNGVRCGFHVAMQKSSEVGADRIVHQCYVTLHLGNLKARRLSAMLFSNAPVEAAPNRPRLGCPHLSPPLPSARALHAPSAATYAAEWRVRVHEMGARVPAGSEVAPSIALRGSWHDRAG